MFTLYRIAFGADTRSSVHCSMNSNDTELEQVVHTHRTSCRSGWRLAVNMEYLLAQGLLKRACFQPEWALSQ